MSIIKHPDDLSGYSIGASDRSAQITSFTDTESTEVWIPSTYSGVPVTEIGFGAFRGCENIQKIVMPDTVRRIDHSAFRACRNLDTVIMSRNLETLAEYSFASSKKLRSITVPSDLTPVSLHTFDKCISLTEMNVIDKNRNDGTVKRFVVPSINESRRFGFMNACLSYFDNYSMVAYDKGYTVVQEFDDIFNISEYRLQDQEGLTDYYRDLYTQAIKAFIPKLIREDQVERLTSAGALGIINENNIDEYIKKAMPLQGSCIAYLLDLKEKKFKRGTIDFSL